MRGLRLLVGLCAFGGCGGGASDSDPTDETGGATGCTADDIALEVGTGEEAYVPLADGDTVTMVHGPQGGWHVETGGLVTHSETEVSILPAIRSDGLGIDVTGAQQANFQALASYDESACTGVFYGVRAFIETDRPTGPAGQEFVCSLAGEAVTLSVVTEDLVSLRQATAEVDVVLQLDPADIPNCP